MEREAAGREGCSEEGEGECKGKREGEWVTDSYAE